MNVYSTSACSKNSTVLFERETFKVWFKYCFWHSSRKSKRYRLQQQ